MLKVRANWLLTTAILLVVCALFAAMPLVFSGNWWSG